MEIDTDARLAAENAAALILGVAEAFVDASEHDRCLAVMLMCTEVTGVTHAAVGLGPPGAMRTVVATSDDVMALETHPGASGRQSLSECLAGGSVVCVPVHPADVPFDGHAERLLNLGLHHEYLVPLSSRTGVHGVVTLYDADELGRGRGGLALAASLASVAGTLLQQTHTAEMSVGLVGQLQAALTSRVTIEQAKGVLAARNGGGLDGSFLALRQRARNERRSVADVAAEIVRSL